MSACRSASADGDNGLLCQWNLTLKYVNSTGFMSCVVSTSRMCRSDSAMACQLPCCCGGCSACLCNDGKGRLQVCEGTTLHDGQPVAKAGLQQRAQARHEEDGLDHMCQVLVSAAYVCITESWSAMFRLQRRASVFVCTIQLHQMQGLVSSNFWWMHSLCCFQQLWRRPRRTHGGHQ